MDVLGGLSMLSSGIRIARGLMSGNTRQSGVPFTVEPQTTPGQFLIAQRDQDGDGALSIKELGAPENIFQHFDKDADGLLSEAELTQGILESQQSRSIERAIARYLELHDSDHDSLI